MTTHTFDSMDEFFDFDQLELDHSAQLISNQQSEPFVPPDDVTVMDWAIDEPTALLPATDTFLPHDVHVQNVFEDINNTDTFPHWELMDIPDHSPTVSDMCSSSEPFPVHMGNNTAVENALFDQKLSSSLTPLSSIVPSEHLALASGGNVDSVVSTSNPLQGTSLPALERPHVVIDAPSIPEKDASCLRTRPSAPIGQASSGNWKPASAKRKGPQSRIPLEAKQILEDEFVANPYPCSWEMDIIAHQANLEVKKVRNWFNNTRARNKGEDIESAAKERPDGLGRSLQAKLSKDSLEALDEHADEAIQPPQLPLAVYLTQSYQEEAVEFSAVQAAIENGSLSGSGDYQDSSSDSRRERTGSVITSVASSEGTAPTNYTVSSSGSRSNISSFGRDRRRGRRRMAWKESPYNRPKFNGVNSAGEPQKDLPFFCTFCPRAFKTKYEWIRHEDSVHALRTTWICCETKNTALQSCPFCGQIHPDDAHMSAHKYQQCQSKPESQRTFYRRDHFVQHLHHVHFANAKHPSVRVGCQARLMATEGHNFGCKDLAMKWRRFGAPMKQDDPMLHCGMCGKKSKDWSERCEHVAEHLIAQELDRSVWWPERKENHLENLYSTSPYESFRCRYCLKIFTDIKEMNQHSHCKVWSCRFLKSVDDITADNAGPPLCPDFPSAAHHCHLCGAGYRTPHLEHAQNRHRYRSCNQEFYTSEEAFLQHLHNFHGASHPALLQGSSIIEQNFMRNKGASFEPVEFNESWQPCLMDLDTAPIGFTVDKPTQLLPSSNTKERTHTKKQSPTRKKPREEPQQINAKATKTQRQRSDTTSSKTETHGPRFFRLSTYVPFLSSRVFYSHNARPLALPNDNQAVVEEISKPHVASLVMSAGLVSMATVRWVIKPEQRPGMVELTLDDTD